MPIYCPDLQMEITIDVCLNHIKEQQGITPTCLRCLERKKQDPEEKYSKEKLTIRD